MKILNVSNINFTKTNYNTQNNYSKQDSCSKPCTLENSKNITYNCYPLINFKGIHDPAPALQRKIVEGLKRLGCFVDNSSINEKLFNFIKNGISLDNEAKTAITKMRAEAGNAHAKAWGKPEKSIETFAPETDTLVNDLEEHIPRLKQTIAKVGLNEQESDFLLKFISQTALILHNMGFSDAIGHAAQVSRLELVYAHHKGGSNLEKLQAGLVGWLHDPKFAQNVPWGNLTTHPNIAGSLAGSILNSAENTSNLIKMYGENSTKKLIHGIKEALFVNTDSKFVMENDTLHGPAWMPNHVGIADVLPEAETIIRQRFDATAGQAKFVSIPSVLVKKIHAQTQFETGIPGVKIPGDNILCHHLEVKDGKLAAEGLVVADQKLLSPHKIILTGTQKTAFERMLSFNNSFQANINNMPPADLASARRWQKEVYSSIARALDGITGQSHALDSTLTVEKQISALKTIVEDKSSWGKYADIEVADAKRSNDFKELITALTEDYNKTAENSHEMFAI